GVQPGNARPPREVCDDSAHHVMRRRRHRNQIRVWIDPTRNAERENTWEMLLERSFEPRCIEKYLTAGALLPEDRSSHDVPGRELGELVLPEHETVAAIVDQNGSFSTHGLRNERQRCRVPLDGTARTPYRRALRRPGARLRNHRRLPPRDWSCSDRPGRSRQS